MTHGLSKATGPAALSHPLFRSGSVPNRIGGVRGANKDGVSTASHASRTPPSPLRISGWFAIRTCSLPGETGMVLPATVIMTMAAWARTAGQKKNHEARTVSRSRKTKLVERVMNIIHLSWIICSGPNPATRSPEKEKAGTPFWFRQPGCLDQTRGFPSLPRGRCGFIL